MSHPVTLHIYDLSQGMARQFSSAFIGHQIDGIWHTGIVVYGIEYFFGGGICEGVPAQTPYGYPVETVQLGTTSKDKSAFQAFLKSINNRFTAATYDLFSNNCNNFTDECSVFLTSNHIPAHITGLPSEVLNTPFGAMIRPMITQMQQQMAAQSASMLEFPQPGPGGMPMSGVPGLMGGMGGPMGGFGGMGSGFDGMPPAASAAASHPHDSLALTTLKYREPVLFTAGSVPTIFKKAREFIAELSPPLTAEESAILDATERVLAAPSAASQLPPGVLPLLDRLAVSLRFNKVFPLFDIYRYVVLHPAAAAQLSRQPAHPLAALLHRVAEGEYPAAAVVTGLRIAANLFGTPDGTAYVTGNEAIRSATLAATCHALNDVYTARLTAATVLYNLAVKLYAPTPLSDAARDAATQAVAALVQAVNTHPLSDSEALFRLLMALGQFLYRNDDAVQLANALSIDLARFDSCEAKVKDCAAEVKLLLNTA